MEAYAGYVIALLIGGAFGWWARYAFTKTSIAIEVLKEASNDFQYRIENVYRFEEPEKVQERVTTYQGYASVLNEAAGLIEDYGLVDDPEAKAIA